MALPETSLSRACRSIADLIQAEFAAASNPIQVRVGTPAAAQPATADSEHRLNLFFYRFEPMGFGAHELPNEIWRIRVQCVITAFAVDEERISAGESDLRLIGEVLRLFHEQPVLGPVDVGGAKMQAQMVLQPLGLDQIFQLWNTQGDVPYRPSLAYEIALVPIVPKQAGIGRPLVGAVGAAIRPSLAAGPASVAARPVPIVRRRIAGSVPQIAFVAAEGLAQSLSLELGSPELQALALRVCIAGEVGAGVALVWERWDASSGWLPAAMERAAVVAFDALPDDAQATGVAVELPTRSEPGQSVLYARRDLVRPDGAAVSVRSNPLLVTLYEADA